MKNILKLNNIAISKPLSVGSLDVRPYTSSISYIDESRIIKQASEETPVYRLCKDYDIDGLKFALNLVITDKNAGRGEDFMDEVAKKVTKDEVKGINSPFLWLNELYKADK